MIMLRRRGVCVIIGMIQQAVMMNMIGYMLVITVP